MSRYTLGIDTSNYATSLAVFDTAGEVVWAKKRIFPKNRMDCKEILKLMGLPDYNAWEIVKRTNACLMEDPCH